MKIRKAIIPAAGLGTRFLPATKALPKEMLPIVEEAKAAGIKDILTQIQCLNKTWKQLARRNY